MKPIEILDDYKENRMQEKLTGVAKTKERHGQDFYKIIGSKGGKNGDPSKKWFSTISQEDLHEISRRGGIASAKKRANAKKQLLQK